MTAEKASSGKGENVEHHPSPAPEGKAVALDRFIWVLGVGLALYQLYAAWFGIEEPVLHNAIHLGTLLAIGFLLFARTQFQQGHPWLGGVELLGAAISLGLPLYYFVRLERVMDWWSTYPLTPVELLLALGAILAVLIISKRYIGWPMVLMVLVFGAYGFAGPYLPGLLGHAGLKPMVALGEIFMTTQGLLGDAVHVSATYVFIYVLFGAFLERSGAGQFMVDLSLSLAGRAPGGPAKVAVIASGLFGSISGSPATNVLGTGTFTIPLMTRLGYRPAFAGAVEAVASTGGGLMPPVMNAVAFLMADLTGIPYVTIAGAALLPALLYYGSLYLTVHTEAQRTGLRGVARDEIPPLARTFKQGWHFLLPPLILVIILVRGNSPIMAGLWAIVATIVVSWRHVSTRIGLRAFFDSLASGSRSAVLIAAACAAADLIMYTVAYTGLGTKLTSVIMTFTGGMLMPTLLLTAGTCLLLGMGLPPAAAYIIVAVLGVPTLMKLGIPLLAAHLFAIYYANLAHITPPVAVAAFVAAGIAKDNPIRVGMVACRIGLLVYLVPLFFVNHTGILIQDGFWAAAATLPLAVAMVVGINATVVGWFMGPVSHCARALLLVAGAAIVIPHLLTNWIAAGAIAIWAVLRYLKDRSSVQTAAPEAMIGNG